MTDNPDLDARLARLAARKAAAGGAKPNADQPAPKVATLHVATTDDMTPSAAAPRARTKRRHPAAAGRILSVGLSSSAFLSLIAAFGSQTSGASTAAMPKTPITRPAPRPKIVIKDVHHTIYVDQFGRPIPAPAVPKGLTAVAGSNPPTAGSGSKQSGGAGTPSGATPGGQSWPSSPSPGAPAAPGPPAGGNAGAGPATPSNPGNPAPGPSASQPAPGPTPTTPHVSPGPTTPPATSPPATVVTTPPPPPPPACSGTKCP